MNDNALHELMRREADQAPFGDGDDLRRGKARLRRRRAAVGAGGTGLAAVALVVASAIVPGLTGSESATPAGHSDRPFEPARLNADGTITAKVRSIRDVADLELQLEQWGARTDAVFSPAGKECEQPRFAPAANEDAVVRRIEFRGGEGGDWFGITIEPDALRPGQTVVIQTARSQLAPVDGGEAAMWANASVAKGAVEPCHLVDDQDFKPPPFPLYDEDDRSPRHKSTIAAPDPGDEPTTGPDRRATND